MTFTFTTPWFFLALALPLLIHWGVRPYSQKRLAVRSPWFGRLVRFSGRQPGSTGLERRSTHL